MMRGLTPYYVRVAAESDGTNVSQETEIVPERYDGGLLISGNARGISEDDFQEII